MGSSQEEEDQDRKDLDEIRGLLWGQSVSEIVFFRWAQGFDFSPVEPTALVQYQGGPCAVIAPVQAFLLQSLLAEAIPTNSLSEVPKEKCTELLVKAITNILGKSKTSQNYRILSLKEKSPSEEATEAESSPACCSPTPSSQPPTVASPPPPGEGIDVVAGRELQYDSPDDFHLRLHVNIMESPEQVTAFYSENYALLSERFGVLLFLYSVMLTKGVEDVKAELNDITEPLIHNTYGYGSQGLINLMLTGSACAHVFDNYEDVGGLRLLGISQQSDIGFITLMEQLRYCTVGSFYKNPKSPVWVMGSETHLTVLFSDESKLVAPETPSERAKRMFKSYDPDGNNFIQCEMLQEILRALDLVSEDEYVDIMKQKLDPEKLGIILLNAFMEEFFPEERRSVPDVFRLWHYNGIPGSNDGHQVKYNGPGSAVLLECDLRQMVNNSNPLLMCLQTKWPTIEVEWGSRTPSLN